MSSFRLTLYGWGGAGPLTLSPVFPDLDAAVERAERLFVDLAGYPHKRPHRVDVVDLWTRETVTRVTPDTDRDRGVCAACGAPSDPFGLPFESAPSRGPERAGPAENPPPPVDPTRPARLGDR